MTLSEQDVGKLIKITEPVQVPTSMPLGSLVLLFNDTDREITVQSPGKMFISGRPGHRASAAILPRGLANVLFVSDDEALLSGEVT